MAEIIVLEKHVAELIAAGEVVERPASVTKELTENAIDSGATKIRVEIARGGIALIEISDNGCGIEPEYIATAFIRHATSKIRNGEDLEQISTLGFRGEALASIAAVSRVALTTKTEQGEFALCYEIEGGQEVGINAAARAQGTTVSVRDLFYNTPARMKFLKKDQSEANLVQDIVMNLALSHPEISFLFVRDGKEQFQTPGNGELLSATYPVLGREFSKGLMMVDFAQANMRLSGLVTPPAQARNSRSMQFFYVNGRYIKNRTMMAALEAACQGYMMSAKFPGCILSLSMPVDLVDVNVHPAKTEIRFAAERDIFDIVYKAIKSVFATPEASEKFLVLPNSAAEQVAQATHLPESSAVTQQSFSWPVKQEENILRSSEYITYQRETPFVAPNFTVTDISKAAEEIPVPLHSKESNSAVSFEEYKLLGEAFGTYVVLQINDAVCFIDKHAAHERLLYEKLAEGKGKDAAQMLLTPIPVLLSGEEKNALLQDLPLVLDTGLELEDFGGNSVLVRAVPQDIAEGTIELLVQETARKLTLSYRDTTDEKRERVYASVACRAAIKGGDISHTQELMALTQDILSGKIPMFCPHGRPVLLKLTQKELEKHFGRLG